MNKSKKAYFANLADKLFGKRKYCNRHPTIQLKGSKPGFEYCVLCVREFGPYIDH